MSTTFAYRFDELKATDRLPSPTGVGLKILQLTQDDSSSAGDLAAVIQSDPALSGRLLKLANSTRFGSARAISDLEDAVVRLGQGVVRNIALGFSMLSSHRSGKCENLDYDYFWARCLAIAVASQFLSSLTRAISPMEGYTCGLLSQIGCLALGSVYPEEYSKLLGEPNSSDSKSLLELEQDAFAANHNELSAAMLHDWGLPKIWGQAVLHHDDPESGGLPSDDQLRALAGQLRLATKLATACILEEDLPADVDEDCRLLEIDCTGLPELLECLRTEWTESVKSFSLSPAFKKPPSSSAATSDEPPSDELEERPEPIRVLVVDDEPTMIERLRSLFADGDFDVASATNGTEALELALCKSPQLIITDWDMPGADGIELCRSLRRSVFGDQTYVIILTSNNTDEKIVEAFDAGADDFVVKPFRRRTFQARIQAGLRVLRLQQRYAREREYVEQCLSQLAIANRRLHHSASTDPLTSLSNRRLFEDRLNEEVSEAKRHDSPLALVALDLDHFKRVNDEHGHEVGDRLLVATAECLKRFVRNYDVAARIGGEEFAVLCPGTDADCGRQIAERIRSAIESTQVLFEDHRHLNATASLGIATLNRAVVTGKELMRAADEALYAAKRAGRNRVCIAAESVVSDGPPTERSVANYMSRGQNTQPI